MAVVCLLSLGKAASAESWYDPDEETEINLQLPAMPAFPGRPPWYWELLRHRYEAAADQFEQDWRHYQARWSEYQALRVRDTSLQLLEAHRALRDLPEFELTALEAHLKRMFWLYYVDKSLYEHGRIPMSAYCSPGRYAVAEAKARLCQAIVRYWAETKTPPTNNQLEQWWTDLGSRDVAKACAARWNLLAASTVAEPFLRQHLRSLPLPYMRPYVEVCDDELGGEWFRGGKGDSDPIRETAEEVLRDQLFMHLSFSPEDRPVVEQVLRQVIDWRKAQAADERRRLRATALLAAFDAMHQSDVSEP
jgi:hypothetical protein